MLNGQSVDYLFSIAASVKAEKDVSEVIITKEMEEEENQLMEKGERKEKEMMEKVSFILISVAFELYGVCNSQHTIDFVTYVLLIRHECLWRRSLMRYASRDCSTCWRKVTFIQSSC